MPNNNPHGHNQYTRSEHRSSHRGITGETAGAEAAATAATPAEANVGGGGATSTDSAPSAPSARLPAKAATVRAGTTIPAISPTIATKPARRAVKVARRTARIGDASPGREWRRVPGILFGYSSGMTTFDLVPKRSNKPPPSRRQLLVQGLLAALALLAGVAWATRLGRTGEQGPAALAALLIICGLCGEIVTLIQLWVTRKSP
jgi:hypothetical protein